MTDGSPYRVDPHSIPILDLLALKPARYLSLVLVEYQVTSGVHLCTDVSISPRTRCIQGSPWSSDTIGQVSAFEYVIKIEPVIHLETVANTVAN